MTRARSRIAVRDGAAEARLERRAGHARDIQLLRAEDQHREREGASDRQGVAWETGPRREGCEDGRERRARVGAKDARRVALRPVPGRARDGERQEILGVQGPTTPVHLRRGRARREGSASFPADSRRKSGYRRDRARRGRFREPGGRRRAQGRGVVARGEEVLPRARLRRGREAREAPRALRRRRRRVDRAFQETVRLGRARGCRSRREVRRAGGGGRRYRVRETGGGFR